MSYYDPCEKEYAEMRYAQAQANRLRRRYETAMYMDPRDPERPDDEDIEAMERTLEAMENCF